MLAEAAADWATALLTATATGTTFLLPRPAIEVLQSLPHDSTDTLLVLSRNDYEGFWTQRRTSGYLAHLRRVSDELGPLNQTRLIVYPDDSSGEIIPENHLVNQLRGVHALGTLRTSPTSAMSNHPDLSTARYGFTVSVHHRYAILPVPTPRDLSDLSRPVRDIVSSMLASEDIEERSGGELVALITMDEEYVASLVASFNEVFAGAMSLK